MEERTCGLELILALAKALLPRIGEHFTIYAINYTVNQVQSFIALCQSVSLNRSRHAGIDDRVERVCETA